MKKIRYHFWALLSVILVTILTWYKVNNQSFIGEGFQYFDNRFPCCSFSEIRSGLFAYDTLPRLTFEILPVIFKDNLQLYQLWMLALVIIFNLMFYLLVYELTGKKIVALASIILFTVNFPGSYEIIGYGDITYFLDRVPHSIIVLISFILLARFLHSKIGKRAYFASVFLYLLAALMGLFSIFLLPFIVGYTFFYQFLKKINWRNFIYSIGLCLPFILVSFILLWLDRKYGNSLIAENSLFTYIFHNPDLIPTITYQLIWLTIPSWIIREFTDPHFRETLLELSLPVFFFYLGAVFYLSKRHSAWRAFIWTLPLFIIASLFFNAYTNLLQVNYLFDVSRYFYIPTLAWAPLMAMLIYSLFYEIDIIGILSLVLLGGGYFIINFVRLLQSPALSFLIFLLIFWLIKTFPKKILGKLVFVAFIGLWSFFNLRLIWRNMDGRQWVHEAVKISLDFTKKHAPEFSDDAYVVLPGVIEAHGSIFARRFYGKGKQQYTAMDIDWEDSYKKNFKLNQLLVFDYDPVAKVIVDRTDEFKKLLKSGQNVEEAKLKYR